MDLKRLRKEIRDLQKMLAENGFLLRTTPKTLIKVHIDLMAARMEIYRSIAHRQFRMIQILDGIKEFEREEGKAA